MMRYIATIHGSRLNARMRIASTIIRQKARFVPKAYSVQGINVPK